MRNFYKYAMKRINLLGSLVLILFLYNSSMADAKIIELNCPHYVQDYEYATIAEEIKLYLSGK